MKKELKNVEFTVLSKGQEMQITGGTASASCGCGCCLCSPEVKGAGDETARHDGGGKMLETLSSL